MGICSKCTLTESVPGVVLDEKGVCNYCNNYDIGHKNRVRISIDESELVKALGTWKNRGAKYDVLVPVSGGVDSCYALIVIIKKYGLNPLVFHNDHGYENEGATLNVKNLCKTLGVDLVIMQQDIPFMKKLWRYINECKDVKINSCYMCGNILYLNTMQIAAQFGIKLVINGYSKGQILLNNDKSMGMSMLKTMQALAMDHDDEQFWEDFLLKLEVTEKAVHINTIEDLYYKDKIDKITVIPFYLFDFYKTDKEATKQKIREVFDWQAIDDSYPKRTTNCVMNWLNSYVDKKKLGYCVYEFEYAEMIRAGEITREQALSDLEFNPPEGLIEKLAHEIDFDLSHYDEQEGR